MVASRQEEAGLLFGADEAAFLAGEETVEVQPRANLGTLHLIAADYGPLRPNATAAVPLWLALQLRRAHYCRVIPPAWLSSAALEAAITRERSASLDGGVKGLQPLPYYWSEVAHALLHGPAAEDVPHAERLRAQLQTLRELRMAKLRSGLADNMDGHPMRLDNVTSAEVQVLRPVLCTALASFARIQSPAPSHGPHAHGAPAKGAHSSALGTVSSGEHAEDASADRVASRTAGAASHYGDSLFGGPNAESLFSGPHSESLFSDSHAFHSISPQN